MHSSAAAEAVSVAALVAVLAWAVRRPRGWSEAVPAVPAALLVVLIGAVSVSGALAETRRLAPVVGFLACVLVLAKLCDDDGLFRYLGAWLSGPTGPRAPHAAGSDAERLLSRVFLVAAVTTAVLSLDATVVLLTPVVLIAAGKLRVLARPHAYACGHLANSASLLLPVSNLTNLLAFSVSGLSFGRFAALMALPWLAAIGVEYVVIRRFFAADLIPAIPAASGQGSSEKASSGGASSGRSLSGRGWPGPGSPGTAATAGVSPGSSPTASSETSGIAPAVVGHAYDGGDDKAGGAGGAGTPGASGAREVAAGIRAGGGGHGGAGEVEHEPVRGNDAGAGAGPGPARSAEAARTPFFSLIVVCVTLGGFVVASAAGVNPAWAALGGALLLAARALARRETTAAAIAASADVPFLLFVITLGIVVVAVVNNGLESALRPVLPSGSSLPALLAIAALAAALAATVNNLPAVLVLLPLVALPAGGAQAAGPVLAVLIGVNIGPNLTYTGSLATMLWRRVLHASDTDVALGEFTRLGAASVIPGLGLSVLCLWLALHV